jgi:hypothetical protein
MHPPCVLQSSASDAQSLAELLDALITCEGCARGGCAEPSLALGRALARLRQAARETRQLHSKLRQSQAEVELLRADLDKQETWISDLEQIKWYFN